MLLKDKIERVHRSMAKTIAQADLNILMSEIQKLSDSDLAEKALKIGEKIPDVVLPNVSGEKIDVQSTLDQHLLIVSFYRGRWCPYCNLELRAYQEVFFEIKKLNASLVAISPQTLEHSLATRENNELAYEVLSDFGNRIARSFGLVFRLSDKVQEIYRKYKMILPEFNGDHSWQLPVPGKFVVDGNGVIRGRFVNANYTQRTDPSEVLEVLHKL